MSTPDPTDTAGEVIGSVLAAINQVVWRQMPTADGGGATTDGTSPGDGTGTQDDPTGPAPGSVLPELDKMAADPTLAATLLYDEQGTPVAYDVTSLVGVLGAAVAELSTQVADLKRQAEKKPTATYPWEPGWSPFQS